MRGGDAITDADWKNEMDGWGTGPWEHCTLSSLSSLSSYLTICEVDHTKYFYKIIFITRNYTTTYCGEGGYFTPLFVDSLWFVNNETRQAMITKLEEMRKSHVGCYSETGHLDINNKIEYEYIQLVRKIKRRKQKKIEIIVSTT
jgi:hypothetical protein